MSSAPPDYRALDRTSGWVVFSGTFIGLGALANLIFALVVLANPDWLVLTPEALIRFDLTTMGVTLLVFGALQLFTSFGVFFGQLWARVLAIVVAAMNVLAQMAFMSVYAEWSWFVIVVNGLVLYGLTVHGDEIAEL